MISWAYFTHFLIHAQKERPKYIVGNKCMESLIVGLTTCEALFPWSWAIAAITSLMESFKNHENRLCYYDKLFIPLHF